MATKQTTLPTIGPVTLYKRRGNRSLRLSVSIDGEVRVSMPYWLPYKAGEQFAISRADWIAQHRTKGSTHLQHGQHIGKAHHLYFAPSALATRVTTRLKQNQIEVNHPHTVGPEHEAVQQAARSASIRALRKEAEQLLPLRLKQLADHNGFTYKNVAIKQLKSRWGSCSSKQEITLSLFLMQLPWHLIDYVLFHELAHTKVMQHGAPFWQELEQHVPHAKKLRKEIGSYRPVLHSQTI
ncbi:MAG TPA: SprT family zinc-dependent metalloprotease [Candidatus Saccharimonadales bacterium]|nr:SprT family zinc-dependent metalloprotease [Candidatus Saccharimonadales bacterium]